MRSVREIKERIEKKKKYDMFGTYYDLIECLPWSEAKGYMGDDVTEEDAGLIEYTKENVIKQLVDYMEFAYDKAEGARGISAGRSIMHLKHWLWLLEDDEILSFVNDEDHYSMYGFPMLQKIARKYAPDLVRPYEQIENDTGAPAYPYKEL